MPKETFLPIAWFPEDSDLNLAKNLVLAKMFANDGHPEAKEYLRETKVKAMYAVLVHGQKLVGIDDANYKVADQEQFWLKASRVRD
jgi:hypothetical protein